MQTIKKALLHGRLVLLAVAVVIASSGCKPTGPQALLDGERLIRAGNYGEAVEQLKLATQLLPKTAQAWNHLGLAHHGAGDADQARKAYQTALKLDRDLAAARYNLGNLFLEQNQPANAIAEFTTFIIQQPGSTNGWIKLGYAQIAGRQWAAAEQSLARAYRLAPQHPEVLNGLGLLRLQKKNTREAVGFFNAAVQRQPVYPPALLNLAVLTQQSIGNRPLALKMYRDYLALQPRPANWVAVEEAARRLDLELHPPPEPTKQLAQAPAAVTPAPTATSQLAATVPPAPTPSAIPDVPSSRPAAPAPSRGIDASKPASEKPTPSKAESAPKPDAPLVAAKPAPQPSPVVAPPPASPPTKPAPVATLDPGSRQAQTAPAPAPTVAPMPTPRRVETAPESVPAVRPKPTPPPTPPEPPVVAVKPVRPKPTPLPPDRTAPAVTPGVQIARAKPVLDTPKPTAPEAPPDSPPAAKEEKAKEKPGFFQRLNPMRMFRSKPLPPTPLPPSRRQVLAQTAPATVTPVAPPPSIAPSRTKVVEPTVPAPLPVPPPPPKPVIPRYRYLAPAKPASGDRAEAQRHFDEGTVAQEKRKWTEAIEAYRSALRSDPAFFESYYNLGLATLEAGDLGQSLVAGEYALAIDPDAANARFNFALALQRAHYPRDAADELERLLAGQPDDGRAHLALANLYARELADPRRAREHYLKVLRSNPKHPEAAAIGYWLLANP